MSKQKSFHAETPRTNIIAVRKLNSVEDQTNRMTDDIARTIDQLNEKLRFLRDVEDFRGNSEALSRT